MGEKWFTFILYGRGSESLMIFLQELSRILVLKSSSLAPMNGLAEMLQLTWVVDGTTLTLFFFSVER